MRSQKRHLLEALVFIGACIALVAFVVPYLPGASTSLDPSARASAKLGIDVDSVMKKEEQVGRGSIKPENSKKYPFIRSDRAYPGFTLFPEVGSSKVKLLNMAGEVVHEWPFDADRIRLLPNGNVLVVHGSKWGAGVRRWRKLNNVVREYDWDGELVWEYKVPSRVHHDVQLLSNGNILGVQRLDLPASMSAELENPLLRNREIRSDEIFEVNREKKVVWSWLAHEHLDRNSCGKYQCSEEMAQKAAEGDKSYDWTHINSLSELPQNPWYEQGDTRFRPGNVMFLPRNMSTVFIVSKDLGKIVWTYQGNYRGGLEYGHEVHMIPPGLPGAGNILIFDNGAFRGESVVLEVNPSTDTIVWKYENGKDFFCRVQGAAQRLPNGNTLISDDTTPRVFEVTLDGEIVWQIAGDTMRISRAQRYFADYAPQFASLPLG